ncbi:MAG TPA: hypothetical protein VGC77_08675 [Rhodopseudomonas sp.]|uniref:hypothetical protein n=1 Tax=Rhodopseudomonas sp. TaxID=1078 RepID=UPI002EDB19EF
MPEIKNQITLGNAIQIGVMLVALALGWAALDWRSQSSAATVSDHEARLRSLERDVLRGLTQIDERLSRIEGTRK